MKFAVIFLLGCFLVGCGGGETQVQKQNSNAVEAPQRAEKMQSVTAHTTEGRPAPAQNSGPSSSRWSQSGDPIDTSKFDAKVAEAERSLKAKPADEAAKQAVAESYFERAFALTEARQYASALGDYRRALKYDPDHAESKKWIDQIIMIYGSLKKDYPKEGEEPPPLPWKPAA